MITWQQPNFTGLVFTEEASKLSISWIYDHILEPELNTIIIYKYNTSILEIRLPKYLNIRYNSDLVYLYFSSIQDASKFFYIIKELIGLQ